MITFRMSSAGKCPRALSAELLEYEAKPTPAWLESMANEGNWHEKRIKDELIEQGFQVFAEQEELTIKADGFQLVGHIDGRIYTPDKVMQLLEVKSMSQFEFDRWMKGRFNEFPNYLAQVTCYLAGTELDECLYIVKNRNSGYVDTQLVKPIAGEMDIIIRKLASVVESVKQDKLCPAEFDIDNIECRRCEYQKLCIPEPTELDKATKEQLDKAVEEIRLGDKLIAEGKELYDKGKETLKNHTKASGLRKWEYNRLAILLVQVKRQVTYPKELLVAKYGEQELADIAKVKEAYDYLRLDDLDKEQ
jgi:CRISPR/Cas system-associated exonuclease Cas4 (RecB family)